MRRKDKQLSKEETLKLLEEAEYGVLSMVDKNYEPYAVPMNYALSDGAIYFHCTSEGGKKLNFIKENPNVCFNVVDHTKVIPEKFTILYLSGIVYGTIEIVKDNLEKQKGIEAILKKYSPSNIETGLKVIERDFDKFHLLKLKISKITGKGKKV